MGPDWLKDRFNLGLDEIYKIVINVCRHSGWRHVDDVYGEVLLRLHRRYCNDSACFESRQRLLAFVRQDARFCLGHTFRKLRRLEFHDPQELPEPLARATATANEDDIDARDREPLLADCQQALALLATAKPIICDVFRLHCKGVKGKEIAKELGKSEPTVSRYLHDAFDLLGLEPNEN